MIDNEKAWLRSPQQGYSTPNENIGLNLAINIEPKDKDVNDNNNDNNDNNGSNSSSSSSDQDEEIEVKSVPGRRSMDISPTCIRSTASSIIGKPTSLSSSTSSAATVSGYISKSLPHIEERTRVKHEFISAVLFCEFDTHTGPIIVHQYPEGYILQAEWDVIYDYVITKPAFADKIVCVTEQGHRIVSIPKCLNDPKYFRNAYAFTVSFVLDDYTSHIHDILILEPILKEITSKLAELERTTSFLKADGGRETLRTLLPQIHQTVNTLHESSKENAPPPTSQIKIPGTDASFTLTLGTYSLPVPTPSGAAARRNIHIPESDDERFYGTLLQRTPGHKRVQQLSPESAKFFECIVGTLPLVTIAHAAGFERNTQLIRHCAKELLESGYAFVPGPANLLYVVTPKAREFIVDTPENRGLQDKVLMFCAGGNCNANNRDELLRSIKRIFSIITTRYYIKGEKFSFQNFLLFALAHEWIIPTQEGNPMVNNIYVSEIPSSGNPEHSVFLDPDGALRKWV